ncbi:MAG: type II toxin-antitoxin system VapC family toxin [Betaproteobacteria bacterium]|nr:type II toxin-antitoxin system VapC family toxin [Betaproteobacteria bacterium]
MIGIDTNIVLRYLLKDDPVLSPRALEIIAGNECFVTRAALTEVVYTLESYYRSPRADIVRALDALLSLQRIAVEERAVTERAVSWYKGGMDFGDAMIAASSHGSTRVETFDRDFARLARKLRTAPPVEFAVK